MLWMTLTACGQYVDAGEALTGGTITASVELPDRSELSGATTLRHYSQAALMAEHTMNFDTMS